MPRNAASHRGFHRFLLKVPPETAHRIVGLFLSGYQKFLRPRKEPPALIKIPACQLTFSNRLGLAAGFDKNAQWSRVLQSFGFGFIEVGTVTPLPQMGNLPPRLWRIPSERALVNRMGFNNCGVERFRRNLVGARRAGPILANIGKGRGTPLDRAVEDYRVCIERLKGVVDGFVINVSSPNTPGLRQLQSAEFIDSLERVLCEATPIWLKLAPDLSHEELVAICDRVNESERICGVVLTNTSRALAQKFGFDEGGLSGAPLLSRALELVALARGQLSSKKSIIGVGGVSSVAGALKMREAGADLVEVYSSWVFGGPLLVSELARALEK